MLIILVLSFPVFSQTVNRSDLQNIADNWIKIINTEKAPWIETGTATTGPIEELLDAGKLIGYYCNVKPSGFMVFSLRRELAPVKAWSETGTFDPEDAYGIEEVIKTCMRRLVDTIESNLGPIETIAADDLENMVEIDYTQAWSAIETYSPGAFKMKEGATDNYLPGDVLLGSNWHQFPPYNNNCPDQGCTITSNGRAFVGCVATAAAQIMYYWCWPPNDFDWVNMGYDVTTSSPPEQQAAVAQLCANIGQAVDMQYGCDGSHAYHTDMADAYVNNYSYSSNITIKYRSNFTAYGWYDLIKFNLDRNRPAQYGIPDHSIVCDGYWETSDPPTKTYHMNYGWVGTAEDTWYTLDALLGGNPDEENMIHRTYPAPSMGYSLSGTYYPSPVYKYFDMDAAGSNAVFMGGHKLQTLPWIKIIGAGTSSYLKFYGSTGAPTKLYTRGDQSKGIDIQNGCIRLKNNGTIRLE